MKLRAIWLFAVVAIGIVPGTVPRGLSDTPVTPHKRDRESGEVIVIVLRGEAAAYCSKQIHPERDISPRLLETPAALRERLPDGWLRFDASIPTLKKQLLTIS